MNTAIRSLTGAELGRDLTKEEREGLYLSLFVPIARITSPQVWAAGADPAVRILVDAVPVLGHFALTATGSNVLFSLTWGTDSTRSLNNILPPFAASIPGQVQLKARPISPELPAEAEATCIRGGTCCHPIARGLYLAGETVLAPAYRLTALAPSVVTPPGLPNVALAAGESFPVVAPTAVVSGTVLAEYSL